MVEGENNMKTVFIIIWMIVSTGDSMILNPESHVTVVADEKNLAKVIDKIERKGYKVDIKIYKATQINYELSHKSFKKEITDYTPYIKLKEIDDEFQTTP